MRIVLFSILFGCACLMAPCGRTAAQPAGDQGAAAQALGGNSGPGNAGVPGGASGGIGRHANPNRDSGSDSGPGEMPYLKPVETPRQRLDAGALYCHTEAQLKQHQAAVMARLAGRTAPEPGGCHIVRETVPVSVVERDGQAVIEVQMAGDEPQLAWTDAVIRDSDPLHSPMK